MPESQPLLSTANVQQYGRPQQDPTVIRTRHIGIFSAVFIIFNRIIGTGYDLVTNVYIFRLVFN